ncbi:MAG: hypothetical protein K2R98_23060 [Gemmataceae bacterium]|nr:hypothetical protein [Gemmataceae bacterium]
MGCRLMRVMLILSCLAGAARADDEPTTLKRSQLEKLEGGWQLKADPKEGWKGTVRATITMYQADGKAADFGRILYDFDLTDGLNKSKVANAPRGGVSFAGVQQGKSMLLVTSKQGQFAPFKVEVAEDASAMFEVKDDKLTLDLSKSLKAFVPGTVREMKIDWSKTTWEKVKK